MICAQKNVRPAALAVHVPKKQFGSRPSALAISPCKEQQDGVLLRETRDAPKPAKATALTGTRDVRRFGREDFDNGIQKLLLAKRL
jgi:hypothetical protein